MLKIADLFRPSNVETYSDDRSMQVKISIVNKIIYFEHNSSKSKRMLMRVVYLALFRIIMLIFVWLKTRTKIRSIVKFDTKMLLLMMILNDLNVVLNECQIVIASELSFLCAECAKDFDILTLRVLQCFFNGVLGLKKVRGVISIQPLHEVGENRPAPFPRQNVCDWTTLGKRHKMFASIFYMSWIYATKKIIIISNWIQC